VEHLDASPVEIAPRRQRLEELELGRARGDEDAGVPTRGDRPLDAVGGVSGRRLAELSLVVENERADVVPSGRG
jgi:hypothetical protein